MGYVFGGKLGAPKQLEFDVLIVGAGLAGLYGALHIDPALSCCVLTKERLETSNSWLAQGGIAAAVAADDTPEEHLKDTLEAGAGICKPEAVKVLVDEGPGDILTLSKMDVPFDLDMDGNFGLAKEGGHSKRRVLHAGGDKTGRETVKALFRLANIHQHIQFYERAFLVDILLDEQGDYWGALVHMQGTYHVIKTKALMIASGGIGQVYARSTNPPAATGDGVAACIRAGVKVRDMEFVQFHPTGFWKEGQLGQAFLISETLRGEGAVLKNGQGIPFMADKHPRKDLAPRDIVARTIWSEMDKEGAQHVYLDITQKERSYLEKRFPTIFEHCLKEGIDMSEAAIAVCPVQHYLIGGIETDLKGKTNVAGIYACGEAASTGVHGANRLAANSLLECLVFSRRAAADINTQLLGEVEKGNEAKELPQIPLRKTGKLDITQLRETLQKTMERYVSVWRNGEGLQIALSQVTEIFQTLEETFEDSRQYIELYNTTQVALEIIKGALLRVESVGAHYREE